MDPADALLESTGGGLTVVELPAQHGPERVVVRPRLSRRVRLPVRHLAALCDAGVAAAAVAVLTHDVPVSIAAGALFPVAALAARRRHRHPLEVFARLAVAAGTTVWVLVIAGTLVGWHPADRTLVELLGALTAGGALAGVAVAAFASGPASTIVVGSGSTAALAAQYAHMFRSSGLRVVGYVGPRRSEPGLLGTYLGSIDGLAAILRRPDIAHVIVALDDADHEATAHALRVCAESGIPADVVPSFHAFLAFGATGSSLGGLPLVDASAAGSSQLAEVAKRAFDLCAASLLLAITAPVLALIAAAVRLDSAGPAIFRDLRIGRHGRPFETLKFRTMVERTSTLDAELLAQIQQGSDLAGAVDRLKFDSLASVTRIGHFLRATSLDELPQLWNVVRGEMSLVGPRPMTSYVIASLDPVDRRRLDVRPGITGLWQVMGRSDIGWEDRMQLDWTYAYRSSFSTDLRILLRTPGAVLRRRGAY